ARSPPTARGFASKIWPWSSRVTKSGTARCRLTGSPKSASNFGPTPNAVLSTVTPPAQCHIQRPATWKPKKSRRARLTSHPPPPPARPRFPPPARRGRLLPLPKEEGWGEGKQPQLNERNQPNQPTRPGAIESVGRRSSTKQKRQRTAALQNLAA